MSHADGLIARARAASGLDDFGCDGFREGLEILVAALAAEARLNDLGAAAMDAQIVDLLSQRLEVEDWYRRHPEIDDVAIDSPLIGLGLPRTGSTALACLLAEDPAVRSLRTWESMRPCPPPGVEPEADERRVVVAQANMERRSRLFPRMVAMLPTTATSPTECQTFMSHDFKSQMFQAFANIPSYIDWLNHRADLAPTYTYVRRVLKLLAWHDPVPRWRIKNPTHALFIDALDQTFPDARFVMTHRDVTSVILSVADLYFELHKAYSDHVDMAAIGGTVSGFCELAMRRMIAFRDAGNDDRFFDIMFAPFQADPFPIIEELYAFLGEDLTAQTRVRMEQWRKTTPRDIGYQRTDMTRFGLDPAALRSRFRFYSERFDVPQS